MAPISLTRNEADNLITAPKVVTSALQWTLTASGGWRLRARVLVLDTADILDLHGQVGRVNHSFALLYRNQPIRRYTKHARHPTPTQVFTEPHKHVWDGRDDNDAYIPPDIDPCADVNDQFLAFCRECNIDLRGPYQSVMFR